MKQYFFVAFVFLLITMFISDAKARDTRYLLSIASAVDTPDGAEALDPDIPMYFAGQKPTTFQKKIGVFVSNRKTNAFLKKDETACNWALLSALKSLQERAVKEGGNAVINIESYYKKVPYKSATKFECYAGATIAGVALRGTVVKR